MKEDLELIQKLLDAGTKAGLMADIGTAGAVAQAWERVQRAALKDVPVKSPIPPIGGSPGIS